MAGTLSRRDLQFRRSRDWIDQRSTLLYEEVDLPVGQSEFPDRFWQQPRSPAIYDVQGARYDLLLEAPAADLPPGAQRYSDWFVQKLRSPALYDVQGSRYDLLLEAPVEALPPGVPRYPDWFERRPWSPALYDVQGARYDLLLEAPADVNLTPGVQRYPDWFWTNTQRTHLALRTQFEVAPSLAALFAETIEPDVPGLRSQPMLPSRFWQLPNPVFTMPSVMSSILTIPLEAPVEGGGGARFARSARAGRSISSHR